MRFRDIILEAAVPEDATERQQALKELIDKGEVPDVYAAGYQRGRFSMGDLVSIGYAKKINRRAGRDTMESWWEYTGPGEISLDGKTPMKAGDETDHIEWDPT